ncbi:ABC transporter substrate-binding protein [Vibrio hannami]|uniref:substrate-binding periplasmic protein n=1 Tax=Vibrio hannami TaxID=2717094 RepID=UPI00240FF906|nr:ABC transporter substrate-binding protein [Vibrio hannami]MDG3086116.1 ABC transporter substrate-binding protein [Vibrio hannami]
MATTIIHLSASANAQLTHRFITHYIPPFTYEEEGEFHGFAIDIVKEMMRELGHPVEFEMFPFSRGLLKVQTAPNIAFFIVAWREERDKTIKWVGPLITSGVYMYIHKGNPASIRTLEDLHKLPFIGVGRGNSDHTYLEELGFTNIYPTNDHLISLQMLASDRLDGTPMSELVMPELAKKAKIDVTEIKKTELKLYDSTLYLGFSLSTSDEEVERWQAALDKMKADGRYQELYRRYVHH